MRSPVAVLQAESQVVLSAVSGCEDPAFFMSVQEEARSLHCTIDDALALIELRLLDEMPDTEPIELRGCLSQVIEAVQRYATARSIKLQMMPADSASDLRIQANEHLVRAILGALMREAISTSREDSTVQISFRGTSGSAVFELAWCPGRSGADHLVQEITGQSRTYSPGSSIRRYLSNFIASQCGYRLDLDLHSEAESHAKLSIPKV